MLKIKVARLLGGVEEEARDRELLHRLSSGDGPARCLVGVRCALLFPDRPRVHENVVAVCRAQPFADLPPCSWKNA